MPQHHQNNEKRDDEERQIEINSNEGNAEGNRGKHGQWRQQAQNHINNKAGYFACAVEQISFPGSFIRFIIGEFIEQNDIEDGQADGYGQPVYDGVNGGGLDIVGRSDRQPAVTEGDKYFPEASIYKPNWLGWIKETGESAKKAQKQGELSGLEIKL